MRYVVPIITVLVTTSNWRLESAEIHEAVLTCNFSACPRLRVYGTTYAVTGNDFAMVVLATPSVYVRLSMSYCSGQ